MKQTLRLSLLAAFSAVLLAACNGGDAPADDGEAGGDVVTFVAVDVDFEEAPSQISAGDVDVELRNDGNMPHNVIFEGVEGDNPIVEADGGSTETGSVTLEPGEYTAYCGVPGHRESGMEVSVTVD